MFGPCFVMHYFLSFLVCNHLYISKRELVALLFLSSSCLVTVSVIWLFLIVPWAGLQCVFVFFLIKLTYVYPW